MEELSKSIIELGIQNKRHVYVVGVANVGKRLRSLTLTTFLCLIHKIMCFSINSSFVNKIVPNWLKKPPKTNKSPTDQCNESRTTIMQNKASAVNSGSKVEQEEDKKGEEQKDINTIKPHENRIPTAANPETPFTPLTISSAPGTTLDLLRFQLATGCALFDTPGFVH